MAGASYRVRSCGVGCGGHDSLLQDFGEIGILEVVGTAKFMPFRNHSLGLLRRILKVAQRFISPLRPHYPKVGCDGARTRPTAPPEETTTLSVEEIASESGFQLGAVLGTSPVAYRRTFRKAA